MFGPVIVVGAGGVTAEAIRDVARAVLPLTEATGGEITEPDINPLLARPNGAVGLDALVRLV